MRARLRRRREDMIGHMSASLFDALFSLLIVHLGDRHYHQREKAYKALAVLAPIVVGHLERATSHHDPEIQHRAAKLYRPFKEAKLEAEAFGLVAEFPWLWVDDCYLTQYYLELGVQRFGAVRGGPEFADYRTATKLYVRDLLMEGADRGRVREMLSDWAERDRRWREMYQR